MPPLKALIIDDDPIACDLGSFLLTRNGFSVETVQDGALALDAVRKQKPDIILTDIMMPGLDGIAICTQIKNDAEFKGSVVVVISARSFSGERARAVEAGADLFIAKPYNVETFAGIMRSLVGPKQPETESHGR